ncbi:hypothetical protein ACUIJP_06645 [Leuconostoc pseudomesenteroides]|uniref:hypothetical protein n=1 Tax=Leuconostoc pseudomesenteroides TaxID=33968 RepID=UPI00403E1FD4
MDKSSDQHFLFDHDELITLKTGYENVIQYQSEKNLQFRNRSKRYTLYLAIIGILIAVQIGLTIWIYLLAAWVDHPRSLLTATLIAQQYPYLPTFVIVIRIFSVFAILFGIIAFIWTYRWKNLDKINLRHFATAPNAFDQKQDYKQIRIQQMIKLSDYLILIANKKRFRASNGNSRYLVLRKQNDQTLYQQLIDNYRQNILKSKKMKRWINYYLIDATGEKVK